MNTARNTPLIIVDDGRGETALKDDEIWTALDAHGALLFHGFNSNAEDFYRFASRFNRAFLTSPFGDRKNANDHNELQTVTLGQAGLSLHFEFGNSPLRPDLLWLFCRKPAAEGTGGETLLSDATAAFERLDTSMQRMLQQRRIRYTHRVPRGAFDAIFTHNQAAKAIADEDVLAMLHADPDVEIMEMTHERVVFEFTAPAVCRNSDGRMYISQNILNDAYQGPSDKDAKSSLGTSVAWEDGDEIDQETTDSLSAVAISVAKGIKWRAGDFALIDNNRVMHGRRPTSDPERDLLILCSFSTRYRAIR
jgi:alpha-ketoglutarate-dependent taurine dioxygenase